MTKHETSTKAADDPKLDPILRMREACEYLALSRPTLYRLIAAGRLPAPARLGFRAVGWRRSVLDAYVISREQTGGAQ